MSTVRAALTLVALSLGCGASLQDRPPEEQDERPAPDARVDTARAPRADGSGGAADGGGTGDPPVPDAAPATDSGITTVDAGRDTPPLPPRAQPFATMPRTRPAVSDEMPDFSYA